MNKPKVVKGSKKELLRSKMLAIKVTVLIVLALIICSVAVLSSGFLNGPAYNAQDEGAFSNECTYYNDESGDMRRICP